MTMRDRASGIAGAVLLAVALVLLFVSPREFHLGFCAAFMVCAVLGALLALGLVGTDPVGARLRREARSQARPGLRLAPDMPERIFRYGKSPAARWGSTIVCLVLGLGMVVLGVVSGWSLSGGLSERLVLAAFLGVFGLFIAWYGMRYNQLFVKVDAQGIEARMYFRTVKIPWEEVVGVVARHYWLIGWRTGGVLPIGTVYWVYAPRTKVNFTHGLESVEELTALICSITGLAWQ